MKTAFTECFGNGFPDVSSKQARQYQRRVLDYLSNKAVLDTVRAAGFAKGFAAGFEQGFSKGKEEGFAEGELKAKLIIAQQLKAQGVTLEIIMQATGLSQAEIEQL